jgi:hypothetical protein
LQPYFPGRYDNFLFQGFSHDCDFLSIQIYLFGAQRVLSIIRFRPIKEALLTVLAGEIRLRSVVKNCGYLAMLPVFPQQSIEVPLFLRRSPYDRAPLFLRDRPMDNHLAEQGHDKEYDHIPHVTSPTIGTWQVGFLPPAWAISISSIVPYHFHLILDAIRISKLHGARKPLPPVSNAAHQKCVAEGEEATPSATRREEVEKW